MFQVNSCRPQTHLHYIFTSRTITLIVFIITTSLSELEHDGTQLFLVLPPHLPNPHLSPLSPTGRGRCLSTLILVLHGLFSLQSPKCCSLWELFYVKCLEIMYIMILCYTNQIELHSDYSSRLTAAFNPWNFLLTPDKAL